MSYLGSPYSNSYNQDYEYEDDNFDDEDDRENEDPCDESDEGECPFGDLFVLTGQKSRHRRCQRDRHGTTRRAPRNQRTNVPRQAGQSQEETAAAERRHASRVQQESKEAREPVQGANPHQHFVQRLQVRVRRARLHRREKSGGKRFRRQEDRLAGESHFRFGG